eukprot:CAMPEP_0202861880 /NCGR_PEP_ID=MMETSP1391-20130828/3119_1 /ASSEMBLY_ACC=CAM_ASM_000867 /TAXON_ID=1034604 /ORGANISM="Chlamydomonas leiostraca, Strain SAG 11-49" /LENGTH=74 /DNA_ID=CAMNT_0049541321 /DNA_START=167 /DNA_END=391 /DNA_ORIENTATION=-
MDVNQGTTDLTSLTHTALLDLGYKLKDKRGAGRAWTAADQALWTRIVAELRRRSEGVPVVPAPMPAQYSDYRAL